MARPRRWLLTEDELESLLVQAAKRGAELAIAVLASDEDAELGP